MGDRETAIKAIRSFNRYYTNRLGLLSRYRFDTELTLTEARVIFEIGLAHEHTQGALGRDLKVDMGYLNRVTKRLAARGLISIRRHHEDRRVSVLSLTRTGRTMLSKIDSDSDREVEEMLTGMSKREIVSLMAHVKGAHRLLEKQAVREPRIERAESAPDIAAVRILMREYADFLGEDLTFQGFEEELASLPGKYVPPTGALFLARASGVPGGCVALRKLAPGVCEMKRLFTRPQFRGLGVGRALAERVVAEARTLGYRVMRLDTLARLTSAVALYQSMGFRQIPPYCENPLPGVMFWEKSLTEAVRSSRRRRAP
ncbi:MAG TPA: helix-turn-helix domain-containing GNAT family N-acetyltransferase [Spirochaetia bacterium]|nr:helix-turn-helix domain-containing GNAT family N-acetyltransferase [Spirochaetia bacterium]